MMRIALAVAMLAASPAAAQQLLPQKYRGADGKYEMCIKRHVIELRQARGKPMEPLDEVASATVACKRLRSPAAEDVIATIMECGVAVGDGSADQGCPQ
ncbi:hypothetical protein [Antarcticirhabdus aurantiaca]|uniref:Uncharacterized protein n=1 Tax=Antarcticirhabdus aurantiaca TaxID=2606717 RepID=A0ACD4NWT5_9HYPH|nr:hypothetical protein [Antarcticirhabdus aurantiaca]WAJ31149.1 hypothetical protein OXU80_13500 [Jeongeuplla avenae]